jgi:hypothetical protein
VQAPRSTTAANMAIATTATALGGGELQTIEERLARGERQAGGELLRELRGDRERAAAPVSRAVSTASGEIAGRPWRHVRI